MNAHAILLHEPGRLSLAELELNAPTADDVVVDIAWSGISTGTEKLLWSGRMPAFPGMGYPLVPGYESVGRVVEAGTESGRAEGQFVFVPGANCYRGARGLFGGASSRVVVAGRKTFPVAEDLGGKAVLLALGATAYHAVAPQAHALPELIVGHGVLGRLIARIALALGGAPPVVWETNPVRAGGAEGYTVLDPIADERRDYRAIHDVSGDATILDTLVARLAAGGEIVLAGFYADRLSFAFPPAFMREARLRIAAEWKEPDIEAVTALLAAGRLSLDGLITHHQPATAADEAYRTAFGDPACLKMILDWRSCP
jgi:3-hydroxyethyl bacteriochlorophyllide a dehydrogenase